MSEAPSGWYPDSTMPGQLRYWDGTQWLASRAPGFMPPNMAVGSPSTTSRPLSGAGKVAMVGGASALVGSFLPWASIFSVFGTIEVSGFDGDGQLTAAAATAALLLGYFGLANRKNGMVVTGIIAAALGLAVSAYDWIHLSSTAKAASSSVATASPGYGLYLCTVGFVLCGGALLSARARSARA